MSPPLAECGLHACRAQLAEADPEGAAALWGQAQQAYAGLPRPYDAARAQTRLALCQLQTARSAPGGRPDPSVTLDGRANLEAAHAAFRQLGAAIDAGRVRKHMRDHDIAPPHTGGRRPRAGLLSLRDEEVVTLGGQQMTNLEIARTLALSPRTVEKHLQNARRNLALPAGESST